MGPLLLSGDVSRAGLSFAGFCRALKGSTEFMCQLCARLGIVCHMDEVGLIAEPRVDPKGPWAQLRYRVDGRARVGLT